MASVIFCLFAIASAATAGSSLAQDMYVLAVFNILIGAVHLNLAIHYTPKRR